MSFIVKNTTNSNIELFNVGVTIIANDELAVDSRERALWQDLDSVAEISPLITSGDLIISDGLNDITNIPEALAFILIGDFAKGVRFLNDADKSNGINSRNVQDAVEEVKSIVTTVEGNARFTITLEHNGTMGDGTYMGYSNLIPGNLSPIIFPRGCVLEDITFTNNKSNADYGFDFCKNSTNASPFLTVSYDNTITFIRNDINESFNSGDSIFIKYKDEGQNARDAVMVLYMRLT